MILISMAKFKEQPSKQDADMLRQEARKRNIKVLAHYITLGRYDEVVIFESPDEKSVIELLMGRVNLVSSETLVAVKREDVEYHKFGSYGKE
ncbi:MAG: GYD domain-containing protein [Conexivisphaerales archaeon]